MKYKKILIPILVILAVLISGCGRKKETEKISEPAKREVLKPQTEIEDEVEEVSPAVITYVVKLSGKTLSLYEVNGEIQKLITSIEISPELYPAEDTERLKAGIGAYCKEDGYAILENFAN